VSKDHLVLGEAQGEHDRAVRRDAGPDSRMVLVSIDNSSVNITYSATMDITSLRLLYPSA